MPIAPRASEPPVEIGVWIAGVRYFVPLADAAAVELDLLYFGVCFWAVDREALSARRVDPLYVRYVGGAYVHVKDGTCIVFKHCVKVTR